MRILFSSIGLLYLIGWIRYFIPAHPNDKPKTEYQDRLNYLISVLRRLKEIGDIYHKNKRFPEDYVKISNSDFPTKYWNTISKHIQYTIKKYNKISRFSVNVWNLGPAGLNMPGYPGLIISHDVFWNDDIAFALDILLHEAYHDFYIGHGADLSTTNGKWELNIPLRRGLVAPNKLFSVNMCGAFMEFCWFLMAHKKNNITLWSIALDKQKRE